MNSPRARKTYYIFVKNILRMLFCKQLLLWGRYQEYFGTEGAVLVSPPWSLWITSGAPLQFLGNDPARFPLLMFFSKNDQLYAFQVPAKYTAKFKNWILDNLFSPPVTELDCETKQKT